VNALSTVLVNNQTLQAALSCFPRDRAVWIDGEAESRGGATIDRYSSPAHGPLVTRAPRGTVGYETVDDTIGLAIVTSLGLSASIWSRDVDTAIGVGHGVRAGTVWVNTFMDGTPELPFGGYGQSGLGRELGHSAVADYTEKKTFHVHTGPRPNLWLPRT
jgi:hypothetical protein